MSEPLTISRYSDPAQQRQQADDYIRRHLQDFFFRDDRYSYLPIPFIKNIATRDNILAVISRDRVLAEDYARMSIPNPSHSHDFLTNKIFKYAKRCFVSVMYAKESMYFLRQLTNNIDDGNLPIEVAKIEPELADALEEFVAQQEMFCAPVMKLGDFEQRVERAPLVSVEKEGIVQGREMYVVEFHEGHVEEGMEREYFMVGFGEKMDAEKSEVWEKGRFGFWWGEEYFLCYE